ncbi:MAG: CAP domain-containing protein [Oscillospiraceae bacterium]|nr:CAP domain-containing protein [Oscillospiraceae bacterium]
MKKTISKIIITVMLITSMSVGVGALGKGCVLGGNEPTIFDVIEILKYLTGMDSAIENKGFVNTSRYNAATISNEGIAAGKPTIFCAVEILKYLVGVENNIGVNSTPRPPYRDTTTDDVVKLTNKVREQKGKPALKSDNEALNSAAAKRAEELVQYYNHDRPDGRAWMTVFGDYNITGWGGIAENIASGYTSPQDVVDGWINSPDHYKNIMGNYTHIGVGYARSSNGTQFWVQLFLL